jgi:AcrR family transcriptional regulator
VLTDPPVGRKLSETRFSPAQERTMVAALNLFADHGVTNTSLQMIADRVGVSKAAVYYQFKTKDAIVIAVTTRELSRLEEALEVAEAEADPLRARKVLLMQFIEIAVTRRRWMSALNNDPVIVRLLGEHGPFREFVSRLYAAVLLGEDAEARVVAAVLSAAIVGSVVNPLVTALDDDTLRATLINLTHRMLDLPPD